MRPLPVLWLYGPPGVGKTTVTWELFRRLADEGRPVGYVDIDQLGMCYGPPTAEDWAPEPAGDHGRHRLEARTLDAVLQNFRDAGVHGVIVPGVVHPVHGVLEDLVPHAALTVVRLRADRSELVARLDARNNPFDDREGTLACAEALDRDDGRPAFDTTGLTVVEVADHIRTRTGWPIANQGAAEEGPATGPDQEEAGPDQEEAGPDQVEAGPDQEEAGPDQVEAGPDQRVTGPDRQAGRILWLCGPPAVGKSTVGWQVYQQMRQAGVAAAFVDLDQIGFRRPAPANDPGNHRLKAANLATVWRSFRAAGADCLVAVGPLDRVEDYAVYAETALPITLCLLRASRRVLEERVALRGRGVSPASGLAGDELRGLPADRLRAIADRSARTLTALNDLTALSGLGGPDDLHVDTDDRPATQIAAEILRRTARPADRAATENAATRPRPADHAATRPRSTDHAATRPRSTDHAENQSPARTTDRGGTAS
jgi:shikimate kinase